MMTPGYNLSSPDKSLAITILSESFDDGQALALWEDACRATNSNLDSPSFEELSRIFNYLASLTGRAAVHGMSLKLRLMAYQNILALQPQKAS